MKLLRAHFRTIVRLAQEAPFLEIRQVFRELVAFLQSQVAPPLCASLVLTFRAETRSSACSCEHPPPAFLFLPAGCCL